MPKASTMLSAAPTGIFVGFGSEDGGKENVNSTGHGCD